MMIAQKGKSITHAAVLWVTAVWFVVFRPLRHAKVRTRPAIKIKKV